MNLNWLMVYTLTNDLAALRGCAPLTEQDIVRVVRYNLSILRLEVIRGE